MKRQRFENVNYDDIIDQFINNGSKKSFNILFKHIMSDNKLVEYFKTKCLELSPDGITFGLDVWIKLPTSQTEEICKCLLPQSNIDRYYDNIDKVLIESIPYHGRLTTMAFLINRLTDRLDKNRIFGVLLDNYSLLKNETILLAWVIDDVRDYIPNLWKLACKLRFLRPYISFQTSIHGDIIPIQITQTILECDAITFQTFKTIRTHLEEFLWIEPGIISIIMTFLF